MKSLAEHLGVVTPVEEDKPPTKMSVRDFCREILYTQQYRESLLRRILTDELPPAIECMLWDRAYGKVKDKLEVTETTRSLDDYTAEELEQRLLLLHATARRMRLREANQPAEETHVEDTDPHSVH